MEFGYFILNVLLTAKECFIILYVHWLQRVECIKLGGVECCMIDVFAYVR